MEKYYYNQHHKSYVVELDGVKLTGCVEAQASTRHSQGWAIRVELDGGQRKHYGRVFIVRIN